jgi:hypothetical protein
MLENDHLHFIQDRSGGYVCIDVSKLQGSVIMISFYSCTAPMYTGRVDLTAKMPAAAFK